MTLSVRCFLALLLILLASAVPGESQAAKRKQSITQDILTTPMKVVIVRSSDKACEPYCPEWIMAEGMITSQTPAVFINVYLKAKARAGVPEYDAAVVRG